MSQNESEATPNWGEISTSSLQAVLQWSLRQGGDGTQERALELLQSKDLNQQKWLAEAFESLTVDIVKVITEYAEVLRLEDSIQNLEKKIEALEGLTDIVEDLDNARDLHLIGGLAPVVECLPSVHTDIRWRALDLIATVVQNNPICQSFAEELQILSKVLPMLDDSNTMVVAKSVRCLSCLVRDNATLQQRFLDRQGIELLLTALQKHVRDNANNIAVRILFFISHLYVSDYHPTRAALTQASAHEKVVDVLKIENEPEVWEKALFALSNAFEHSADAVKSQIKDDQNLKELLQKRQSELKNLTSDEKESRAEEINYVNTLLGKL